MIQKVDKLDFIKIRNFCFDNDILKGMKTQDTVREKIFAIHLSDEGLISRIYKDFSRLNNNEKNNPITKMNRHFTKEDKCVENNRMKICSTSLAIMKMQIKTAM